MGDGKRRKLLKKQNQQNTLEGFLKHHFVGVRYWAAAYLLPIIEPEAIQSVRADSASLLPYWIWPL
ncbi:hypothetical protein IQ277_31710 [Nostocales cyanobacterium LEGE 12452]|nr:hypothetical protein [Nostocales cyanobacterium LEGE 12452]